MLEALVLTLFFWISLLIPEIPPFYLEFFWAVVLVFLWLLRWRRDRTFSVQLPQPIVFLWVGILGLMTISTGFSQSIGQSVLRLIRWIEYFSMFFYVTSAPNLKRTQIYSSIMLCGSGTIFLFALLFIARITFGYFGSNALTASVGHHPISYALFLFVPFLFRTHPLLTVIGSTVLGIVSGSRIAMALLIILLFILSVRSKSKYLLSIFVSSFILVFIMFTMMNIRTLPFSLRESITSHYPILAVLIKEPTSDTLRTTYVSEAIQATKRYPLFGYGPGTFELISRRFQGQPTSYSAYAHSFPVELFAENGIPTTLAVFVLLFFVVTIAIQVIKDQHKEDLPYAISILFFLVYGCFDTAMNFESYMMLFWIYTGVLLRGKYTRARFSFFPVVAVLSLISILSILSLVFGYLRHYDLSFLLMPTRKDVARMLYTSPTLPLLQPAKILSTIVYKNDPDMLYLRAINEEDKVDSLTYLIQFDQYNYSYWTTLFLAASNEAPTRLPALLCTFISLHIESPCQGLDTPSFVSYSASPAFRKTLSELSGTEGAAQFLYAVGLNYHEETNETKIPLLLWEDAMNIAPKWGFYHLELASGELYWHNDRARAERIIEACMRNPISREGCMMLHGSLENLYLPGVLRYDIHALPALLP